MARIHDILNSMNNVSDAAHKTYDGKKRSDLKDSDFLFPESRSFPIVSPQDVKDAISNFGRMKGDMSYESFLHKLYNFCKRKGPEFVAALPEASKDKLGIKSKSDDSSFDMPQIEHVEDSVDPNTTTETDEYKQEFLEMAIASLNNILHKVGGILKHLDSPGVQENLTEPWLQGMIAITEDNMATIHDFVMYNTEDADTTTNAGSKPGLWDNIRKKKERMGKNYRPAKPGDKDRPDPDQWKKLTK